MYFLDPRKAGTDAAPDVETIQFTHGLFWRAFAAWQAGTAARVNLEGPNGAVPFGMTPGIGYKTEAEAIRAAREAAGFGDVAEQPCEVFSPIGYPDIDEPHDECSGCRWSRDAHKGVPS